MFDCSASEARQLVMNKQAVETELIYDLYDVFSNEFLPTVRKMCEQSVEEVNHKFSNDRRFTDAFPGNWSFYSCMRGQKTWNGFKILGFAKSWSSFECGDWIRVFGEIVEQGYYGAEVNQDREKHQSGPSGTWDKVQIKGGGHDRLVDTQGHKSPDSHRRRVHGEALTDQSLKGYSGIYGGQLVNKSYGSEKKGTRFDVGLTMTPARDLATSMPFSGIMNWAILDNDLTGKIERYFGLMRGATISGTTTDNIFFLKRFYNLLNDKIFFLLPLATIGVGGHHSLIEIALPLTLNGYTDYSIGCYATLFPKNYQWNEDTRGGAQAIKNKLRGYDQKSMANMILCYYEARQLAGCYIAEQRDLINWRYNLTANARLLERFKTLPAFPKKGDIQSFAGTYGLAIR